MPDTAHLTDPQREELGRTITKSRNLIAGSQIEQAMEALSHFQPGIDPEHQLTHLSYRWRNNERENSKGVLRREDYQLEKNKVVDALLDFLDDLQRAAGVPAPDPPARHPHTDAPAQPVPGPDRVITSSPAEPPLLFLLYHPADASVVLRFVGHLRLLVRARKLQLFDIEKDTGLGDREASIRHHLHKARLIVCCITTNFMDQPYEWAVLAHQQDIPLAPVLLEPTDLEFSIFEKMVCLPRSGGPVSGWANTDAAYKHVVEEIKRFLGL